MAIEVTIRFTGESADEVREQATSLATEPLVFVHSNGSAGVTPEAGQAGGESRSRTAAKVKINLLWSHLGDNIRGYLLAAAQYDDGWHPYEIAKTLSVDPKRLRSWGGNLGRALKTVNLALGEPPGTKIYNWDNIRQKWVMPDEIRQAILSKKSSP